MLDNETFRETLGQFATGVAVVISGIPGCFRGMTINSLTSVSLMPPLVLFCADNQAETFEALKQSQRFTLSVLSAQQEQLSRQFALLGPQEELFNRVNAHRGTGDIPYLADSLAFLDCSVQNIVAAGDHHIIVGHVDQGGRLNNQPPLLYFQSQYRHLKR